MTSEMRTKDRRRLKRRRMRSEERLEAIKWLTVQRPARKQRKLQQEKNRDRVRELLRHNHLDPLCASEVMRRRKQRRRNHRKAREEAKRVAFLNERARRAAHAS